MKKSIKHILIASIFVTTSYIAQAAPAPPPGGGGASCWPPPCVPIDGGIGFLIAAAAVYGGKKLYDYQKKS